jgi:hypothetical protein
MDFTKLTRDYKLIENTLVETQTQYIAKQACKIVIPYNYLSYRMAKMGEKVTILAVAAFVVGNRYGVLNGCCAIDIKPDQTRQVKTNGTEWIEFSFEAGSPVISDRTIVKDSDLLYEMNKYFYSNGRAPDFMTQDDMGNLFALHREYGGLNISPNNVPFEIVTSIISHDSEDKFKFWRHGPMDKPAVVVPFNSVLFNASSTTAKLLGANLEDGVTSALVSPTTKPEAIENMLRK